MMRRGRRRSGLPDGIVGNSTLRAACIGGAMRQADYQLAIEVVGLRIRTVRNNPSYRFISDSAQAANRKFGIKSAALVADGRRSGNRSLATMSSDVFVARANARQHWPNMDSGARRACARHRSARQISEK